MIRGVVRHVRDMETRHDALISLAKRCVNLESTDGDTIRVVVDRRSERAWTVILVGDSVGKPGFVPITTRILSAKCVGKTPGKAYDRIESVLRARLAARK